VKILTLSHLQLHLSVVFFHLAVLFRFYRVLFLHHVFLSEQIKMMMMMIYAVALKLLL